MGSSDGLNAAILLVIEHAPRLRTAGVHSLSIDGVAMVLLPPEPPSPQVSPPDEDEAPRDLLHDPSAYGLPEDAELPGFRRPTDME